MLSPTAEDEEIEVRISVGSKTEHVQSNFEVPPRFKKDVLSPLRNEQPEKLSARVETSISEKPSSDKISIATKVAPSNKIVKSSSNLPERTNVSLKNHNGKKSETNNGTCIPEKGISNVGNRGLNREEPPGLAQLNNKFLAPSRKTDLEENMLDDTYTNSTIISPLTPLRARLLASSKKQAPILQVNNFRKPTIPIEYKPSSEVLQIAAKQPFEDFRKLPQTLSNSMSDHSIKEFVDDQSITMNIIKSLSSNFDEISLQQLVPPPLILPKTAEWDVYITVVTPNANIYARLLGEDYSIIYENMATDMELYYMNTIAVVDNPMVGNYYAIKLDDCWHRVLVQEIQEQQEGRLFFIDQGDEEWHPLSSLCHLEPKFAQIPAQAVLCRLHGLEEFIHHPLTCGILTSLVVGKSMIARLISQASENDQAVSVIVFDTQTDDDININFLLAESITHSVSHPFDLPVDIFSLTSLTATLPLPASAATRPKLEPGVMVLNGEGKRAIKVALKDVTATAAMTSFLKLLVAEKETVVLKRLDNEDCGLPVVEIHKILNGSPTSLNASIAFNERKYNSVLSPVEALTYDMSNITVQQKNQSKVPHQSLTLGIDKMTPQANLPYRKIPEIGTYYDVKVQPLEYKWQFSAMMESMQNFYNSSSFLSPTANNIIPGKLYAALHTDVVKPCHCDWSTEDGVIFQNMVLDREFVALVHEVTQDDHDSNETILGLALIDTSNSDDLIIDRAIWVHSSVCYCTQRLHQTMRRLWASFINLVRLKCGAILNTRRHLPRPEWNGPVSYAKLAHSILVESSFISEECVKRLYPPHKKLNIPTRDIAQTNIHTNKGVVSCKLKPCGSNGSQLVTKTVIFERTTDGIMSAPSPKEVVQEYTHTFNRQILKFTHKAY
uniref:Tudor domain-containing protein n=1 Tax=Timema poppense TaxID=170557 RepID=A0A7R9CSQ6_TIMPO|nr:unnamed protein product [Timema poppensis]